MVVLDKKIIEEVESHHTIHPNQDNIFVATKITQGFGKWCYQPETDFVAPLELV